MEHRSVYGPPINELHTNHLQNVQEYGGTSWPLSINDTPKISSLKVHCEKTSMRINVQFDRPFYGVIFSKGFYRSPNCVYFHGDGSLTTTFEISENSCGMQRSHNHETYSSAAGNYVENTLIIQYDQNVQEAHDEARKLRCTWYNYYEKSVTLKPFQVDTINVMTRNFLGDNLKCWMQIQNGIGPWASEVAGIVKIGAPMTMVLAIKDDEKRFDMLVRDCKAHDGKREPMQLVDQNGCVVRKNIMSPFQKMRNFSDAATVVSFAHFQAFKFPDSMNVHFQCVIQVCRSVCPEPQCHGKPILDQQYGIPLSASPFNNLLSIEPRYPSHLSEPSASYSELKSEIVSPPQAQVSQNNSINIIHVKPNLNFDQNKNIETNELEVNLEKLGGKPRSVDNVLRKRRSSPKDSQPSTNINTSRTIQVVAPGDVTFSLSPTSDNETVIIQSTTSKFDSSETICMSLVSFVSAIFMLLSVLIIASLVATFLYIRLRAINRKGSEFMSMPDLNPYQNTKFADVTHFQK